MLIVLFVFHINGNLFPLLTQTNMFLFPRAYDLNDLLAIWQTLLLTHPPKLEPIRNAKKQETVDLICSKCPTWGVKFCWCWSISYNPVLDPFIFFHHVHNVHFMQLQTPRNLQQHMHHIIKQSFHSVATTLSMYKASEAKVIMN